MFEKMKVNLMVDVIAYILDRVNDDPNVREFVITSGKVLAGAIPGEKIEPQLAEFLDLLKEGILSREDDEVA